MQDESPNEPPATPPDSSPSRRMKRVITSSARSVRRTSIRVFGWPMGVWPPPTVTSLLIVAIVFVLAVELVPRALSDVTLSVRARTEVVELELDPQRTYVWWLPRGNYSLLTRQTGPGCEKREQTFDFACTYSEPTAITIENGATVRLEVLPADTADGPPRFTATLTPHKADARTPAAAARTAATTFEVHDASDQLLVATPELVAFESGPVDQWRIPLILTRIQIGESFSEAIATTDTLGPVPQPIMTEGDVRIFARSIGRQDRYQIQEERFDPADVVQIPADPRDSGLLLGLLSLDRHTEQQAFDLTTHTALAEVSVRRLGGGHRIGVSTWSIVSQLPTWAALWVVWVSLIVVANYHAARLQVVQDDIRSKRELG